jgi:hypothetical protein
VNGQLLEVDEDFVDLWTWLGNVLEELGQEGMSSDESDVENETETIYRPKTMPWRRKMDKELDLIDASRFKQKVFGKQGSKPVRRYRHPDNPVSTREPVEGLPRSFYDDDWFNHRAGRDRILQISLVDFPWMTVWWNNPRTRLAANRDVEEGRSA